MSNFTLEWLQRIVKTGMLVPAVNQVAYPPSHHSPHSQAQHHNSKANYIFSQIHLHPYNYASWKDVLEFSAKHGIVIEAYGCLACVVLSCPVPSYFFTINNN